jgi:hypothetical protein
MSERDILAGIEGLLDAEEQPRKRPAAATVHETIESAPLAPDYQT